MMAMHDRFLDKWDYWLEHSAVERRNKNLFLYDLYNWAPGKPKRVPPWLWPTSNFDLRLMETMLPGYVDTFWYKR